MNDKTAVIFGNEMSKKTIKGANKSKKKFIKEFGDDYSIPSPNEKELMELFKRKTEGNGILNDAYEIMNYLAEFPQKSVQSKLF